MRVLGLLFLVIFGLGTTTYSEAIAGTQFEHLNLSKRAKKKAKKAWQSNPKAKAVFEAISSMQGIYTERAMLVLYGLAHEWPNNDLALDFLSMFSKEGGDAAVKFMEAHLSEAYKQYMQDPNAPGSKEFYSKLTTLLPVDLIHLVASYQAFSVFLFFAGDVCAQRSLNSIINFFTQLRGNMALIFSTRLVELYNPRASKSLPNEFYANRYQFFPGLGGPLVSMELKEKNDKFYNHKQCLENMYELTLRLVCPKYFAFEQLNTDSYRRAENLKDTKAFCKKVGVPLPAVAAI